MRLNLGLPGRVRSRIRRARLRTRVLAGVLAVTLAALVAFDIAGVAALRNYLIGQTDSQLREVLSVYQHVMPESPPGQIARRGGHRRPQVRKQPATSLGSATLRPPAFRPVTGPAFRGINLALLQQFGVSLVIGGKIRAVSPRVSVLGRPVRNAGLAARPPVHLAALAASHHAETLPGPGGHGQLRRMVAPDLATGGILIATTSLDGVDKTVGRLELILIIGSVCAALVAAGGVAWITRRGLRPIEAMAGQADLITAGDLTGRVRPHDGQTEVGRLGSALNGMLSRIQGFIAEREASQQATRRFFTDASHELRTPLASLRANAELYLQGALTERGQVDEAMLRIAAEAKRMGVLVDDMLRLARLDQHPERRCERVNVSLLAEECAQRARTAHPGHTWHTDVAAGLATTGDEELLRRAIDNLLANVAAHTPPGSAATITAARAGGTVTVEVSDDGPGVPDSQLRHIFERFYRGRARSGRPGSGLGLAIVAAATAAHSGTAVAAANDPHGLRVTLTLPAAEPVGPGTEPVGPGTGQDTAGGAGTAGGVLDQVLVATPSKR